MERIGLAARIIPTAGWPMVLAERNDVPGAPTVLLYGHYDVQPPDPLDDWVSPPFEPTIRDGRLYARGVGDNKGQHFAQILALESLLACRGALPCNVKVLLEGEEEIGSPQMPVFVREHRDELQADLVITSDGPVDEDGHARLRFGVRGVLSFELRARGANRDLHSGNWGGVVPNPIWTLVQLLATMKNERGDRHDRRLLRQRRSADRPGDRRRWRACRLTWTRSSSRSIWRSSISRSSAASYERLSSVADLHDQRPARRLRRPRLEDRAAARGVREVRHPPRRIADRRRDLREGGGACPPRTRRTCK